MPSPLISGHSERFAYGRKAIAAQRRAATQLIFRILALQRMRQVDLAKPRFEVALVQTPDAFDLLDQLLATALRQNGNPVLVTLTIADHDMPFIEAHIFHAQRATLLMPQPGPVHHQKHRPSQISELRKYSRDLFTTQHHRKPPLREHPEAFATRAFRTSSETSRTQSPEIQ